MLYLQLYDSIYRLDYIDYMKAIAMITKIAAVHKKLCMYDIELSFT